MAKVNKDKGMIDYTGCYGPRLTYTELQDFLLSAFKADDWAEKNNPGERFSTCCWGHPGTSKTTLIRDFEHTPVDWNGKTYPGYKVVYVPLANYEEMGDILGMPARHFCMEFEDKGNKVEEWVAEAAVDAYKSIGWKFLPKRGVKTFCAPPAWVPQEAGPTILLFDDWNRASLRIIKGVMQLLQTYGTVTWKLPAGSHIVLTGNPDDQDFQVTSLDKAIITRIRSATMKFDVKEWSVWAQAHGLDGRGISWALQFPDMMIGRNQTNPRTLSEVFRMTRNIGALTDKKNQTEFRNYALSLLDEDTVNGLMIYMDRDVGLVADPDAILEGRQINGMTVDKYMAHLMGGKAGEARVDIVGVLVDRMYAYIHQESVTPTPERLKNFQHFITIDSIPEDIRYGMVMRICRCKENGRLAKWILGNKELQAILQKVFRTD